MNHQTPDPARHLARELELPIVCARKAVVRVVEFAGQFCPRDPPRPPRPLARPAPRRSGAPLGLLIATDAAATWEASG